MPPDTPSLVCLCKLDVHVTPLLKILGTGLIQAAFIILLYPVRYVTGICSLHMYSCLFLLLYHHLKLASGHTCKISYCTAMLCVLASMLNLSYKKKGKKRKKTVCTLIYSVFSTCSNFCSKLLPVFNYKVELFASFHVEATMSLSLL